MPLINVYFVWLVIPLALVFTIMAYIYRGMWWWAMLGGLLWILLGTFSITQQSVFFYQRELGAVFIVVGIGVFWTPAYFRKKDQKTIAENLEEDDLQTYSKEMEDYGNELHRYRKLGRRRRPL